MRYLKWIVIGFVVFCGVLVFESGLLTNTPQENKYPILLTADNSSDTQDAQTPESRTDANDTQLKAVEVIEFDAKHAPAEIITLGAKDPNTEDPDTGFKFQLLFDTKGAAIRNATFSIGNDKGFDDRNHDNPQPLVIVSPAKDLNYKKELMEFLSMSNRELVFVDQEQELPLQNLHWENSGVRNLPDGSQSVSFDAIIKVKNSDDSVVKITKTYTIRPADYMLDCDITVENLSDSEQKIRFNLTGPLGLGREGFRTDMRKVIAGFRETTGEITRTKLEKKNLFKPKNPGDTQITKPGATFLWASSVNKYFAFIAVPLPEEGKDYCDWLVNKSGHLYNPDDDTKANTGDEMFGVNLGTAPAALTAAGQSGNQKTYKFQLYIGPKDKSLFDKNEQYNSLGFVQTIDFLGCCCPAGIIYPLAFGILALMKMMFAVIPNYGFVIIILVFLMRLIIHPLTKKSQVSMSKVGKLAPKVEEIKKKYANNKAEMNKQMMAVYREQGASPIMGMLPMMVQMPIWIALWSAVYTSIDLRGASFLPFWITDLSVPDAAYTFGKAIVIPLLGWKIVSINLLPILMGVAFYLQQKLMPSQADASTNPQLAQQQKMMKIMMPLMFPIFLYNGPSGVNLYIMSSTFAGVIEQYIIRKHIREKDEAESQGLVAVTKKTGGKVKKKKPKPFFKT